MARKNKKGGNKPDTWDDPERDEVDAFHDEQDEILLNKASEGRKTNEEYELSDEEIMALSDQEDDDDDQDDLEEGEYEGWGRSRENYYGADEVEDEEDAKLEEDEALRLQQKHLEELSAGDYYEEDDLEEWKRSAKESMDSEANVVHEQLPEQDPALLNDNEKMNMLNMSYPELLPLAKELGTLRELLPELKEKASSNDVFQVKFSALTAYLGTINAYFALFVNGINDKISFKNHPVMEGILKAKEVWRVAQDLEEDGKLTDEQEDDSEENYDDSLLNGEEIEEESDDEPAAVVQNNKRKAPSQEDSERESSENDDDEFAISRPSKIKPTKKKKRTVSDFGEAGAINDIDMEEKEAKKRSIRFYTSKISQTSKKDAERLGGDDDLPYKERLFERQQRLNEEARKRGEKNGQMDEADNFDESDDDDRETARQVQSGFDDDYYNMVKSSADKKKQDKKEAHKLAVQAAKEGKLAELQNELGDSSGKRAIDYQILKNKGLTPKRNKDNRNSRVKKRKKYAAAQKKLASTRQVYKQPTTAYGGEQTGIRKNLTRSVKFKS